MFCVGTKPSLDHGLVKILNCDFLAHRFQIFNSSIIYVIFTRPPFRELSEDLRGRYSGTQLRFYGSFRLVDFPRSALTPNSWLVVENVELPYKSAKPKWYMKGHTLAMNNVKDNIQYDRI